MRLKFLVVLVVAFGYMTVMLARNDAYTTAALTQNSNRRANTNTRSNTNTRGNANVRANTNVAPNTNTRASTNTSPNTNTSPSTNTRPNTNSAPPGNTNAAPPSNSNTTPSVTNLVNSLHAVDISGKTIPNVSAMQPDKPIILAKDSENAKPHSGELKPEAAFDHIKHSTLPSYGADGRTVIACVECHHTDQPTAPSGQGYLKTFERREVLTTRQLETSKEVVKSCRVCHFQASYEDGESPASVTYPAAMNRPPSGKLINEAAYHINCIKCHETAKKRDARIKAPTNCEDCHTN